VNILFLTGNWGGPPNGIDRYIMETTRHLVHKGHTCHLFYSRLKGVWMDANIPFSSSRHIEGLHQPSDKNNLQAAKILLQAVRELNPDVTFFHSISHHSALARLRLICPTIGFLHDYLPICLKDTRRNYFSARFCHAPLGLTCLLSGHFIRKPMAGHRLPRLADLSQAKKLVAVLRSMPDLLVASQAVKEAYLQNGFSAEQVHVLPFFMDVPAADALVNHPRDKNVLFVGRLTDRYKGADFLLRAVKRCREVFTVHIVGDGGYLPVVKTLADRLGLKDRVRFHGWAGAEQVHAFYQQARTLVLPSVWPEPFGLVGLEALANATPVIAFDVGGVREWLQDGSHGYLVPYRDVKKLAEKIDQLIAQPDLAQTMGLNARLFVRDTFSSELYIERLLEQFVRCRQKWITDFVKSKLTSSMNTKYL